MGLNTIVVLEVFVLIYLSGDFGKNTKGSPIALEFVLQRGDIYRGIALGLGLLSVLDSVRSMAHSRQGEQGVDSVGLTNRGAFLGEVTR